MAHTASGLVESRAHLLLEQHMSKIRAEPLNKKEIIKLFVFVLLNLGCFVVSVPTAFSIWTYRVRPHPQQVTRP